MSWDLVAFILGALAGVLLALPSRWLDQVDAWAFLRVLRLMATPVAAPPPAAVVPRLEAIAGPVLPPPPAERLAPAQPASPLHPQLVFERKGATEYEQRLAELDWYLGFWCGHSWPGGLRCDARVKH